jgi:starch-binding outer membrane protein, SusD/RagB family
MRNILILIILVFSITSCDKKLDLLPRQSVAEDVALSSDANVKKVLNGAYDAVSSGNLWGGNLLLFSELLGANGEIRWEGTFNQPREVWSKSMITTNSFIRDTWLAAYDVVNISNNIIGAIDVVNDADENRVKGEALFLRGSMFFELVRLYAKPYSAGNISSNPGIPIITTPTRKIDENSYVARSTVEQSYTQIVADLTEAESLLPNTNGVYANKAAAAAMLSRVYLQMERFADARDAADRAITVATAAGRNLATTYAAAFNNSANSTEYLFAIQVSALDGANSMHLYWSIPAFGGRDGDVSIQAPHLSLYDPIDTRRSLFYTGAGATRSGKWKEQYKNLPIIRLAEMYLTRAEANFRLGTSVGATPLQDVNRVRQRAGLLPLVVVTLDDVLLERKLELAHEGHAIHDRKRLRLTTDALPYDSDKLVFPIPQREIDASNGVLIQNSGY